MSQRIAIVGSGIAGLACAWWLSRRHAVTLFERNDYLGGHTHTHEIELDGERLAVDSGFIVFNPLHYPLLTALFAELGVATRPTVMSFSVRDERRGLEYGAGSLRALFCQRRNLVSPAFWRMLLDLARFYRQAPGLLDDDSDDSTLDEYLTRRRYGELFAQDHLIPMASALWSAPASNVMQFPARYLVQFMANHQMLRMGRRAPWRIVMGGSARYIDAMRARWRVTERVGCAVRAVVRRGDAVLVDSADGRQRFDQVVLACHSDEALSLLDDPDNVEREVLGAIRYQPNEVVLHTDERLLPRRRDAWSAWNAHVPRDPGEACTVSYCMNLLQGIDVPTPLIVTLNRTHAIRRERVLKVMQYAHPIHDRRMVAAQARRQVIQGKRRTWFAGAYWGWGFHEDGIRSAHEVVRALDRAARSTANPHLEPAALTA